jgi:scyllo-inosose 3-dehydrogenase
MRGLVVSAEWQPREGYRPTSHEERTGRARRADMVYRDPRLAVGDRPDPALVGEYDVLIRNVASGICGTDLYLTATDDAGYMTLPAPLLPPVAIGHEYSGQVVEIGSAVTRVRPGDIVAVEAQAQCGTCHACQRGLPGSCEFVWERGFSLDGGTATFSVAQEGHCWPLADVAERVGERRAYDVGAIIEPVSVAYNGIVNRAGGFLPGAVVVVFGAGPIGLAAIGLASALGAGRVVAVDPSSRKRDIAQTVGASDVLNPATEDVASVLLDLTRGAGADMAVDATGAGRRVMPTIVEIIGFGGKIVSLGANMEPVEIDTIRLLVKAASIFFTVGHLGGGFPAAIALHAAGKLDLTRMITSRFGVEDSMEAMATAHRGEDAKVIIHAQGVREGEAIV